MSEKPLVVIVEDNTDVLELTRTCLEDKYEVQTHTSYETALPVPNALAYILDYNNDHGINGGQWLNIHGTQIQPHQRILVSAIADNWNGTLGYQLAKPYHLSLLDELLTRISIAQKRVQG